MRNGSGSRHRISWVASAVLIVAMAASLSGQSGHKPRKFLGGPLVIEDQGSFFIGGVPKVTDHAAVPPPAVPGAPRSAPGDNDQPDHDRSDVRAVPDSGQEDPARVAGHHGARIQSYRQRVWSRRRTVEKAGIPISCGRALRRYVVDQAGRGRSGFDRVRHPRRRSQDRHGDAKGAMDLLPSFGRITDNGAWTAWFGHLVPANSTILTGTSFRMAIRRIPIPALTRINTSGRCSRSIPWTLASSRALGRSDRRPAGSNQYYALEYYKQLVPNAEVTLPGSTCSSCDPMTLSPANTWTPQNLAALVEKLGGAIVATHSQSGIMGHHMARILKERGHLDLLKGLITLEGSCSLPNSGLTAADFDNIPYLALKGDYTATSMVCQDTVNAINARRAGKQGTAKADYLKLDDMGILGVTHMMMLDTKNLEIADVLLDWVNKNVKRR